MSSSGVEKEKRGSGATVRACDSCRRRKRKCVWSPGAEGCTPCLGSKESCSTTHIRKPRAKSQKRANRIADYEARIKRLETLLVEQNAAQPPVEEQPLPPADRSTPLSDWVSNLRDEINSWPLEEGPHIGAEGHNAGFEGFDDEWAFPSDSGLGGFARTSLDDSIAGPSVGNVLAPVPLGNSNIAPEPAPQSKMQITHDQPPLVRAHCDGYLPHPELGISLLSEFLVDFNTAVPLYQPCAIESHIHKCYMGGSDGTPMAWASTYVVFGIAHRLRAMSAAATPQDNEQADYYMSRVLQLVPNLLLELPSLGLIQCLLGLATLIQTSSHSTPHASFVSTALRMAQCLAYNDDEAHPAVPAKDIEQQRRVFWIAFCHDMDESILSNAPTSHRREDIAASRPEEDPQDAAGAVTAAECNWRVNIFSLRARLALLQAEAIEKVVSVKARDATPQLSSMTARCVLQGLEDWRKHELFKLNSEQLMQLLYRSDLVHVLSLEASYFATAFRLQAFLNLGMDARVNPFSTDALARLAEHKEHSCWKDARKLLGLLSVAPQGDIGVCWMIKLPVVAALCTVLSQAVHDPLVATPPQSEMREYGRILHMLTALAEKSQDGELRRGRDLCMMLFSKVDTARRVREMQNTSPREVRPFQIEEVIF